MRDLLCLLVASTSVIIGCTGAVSTETSDAGSRADGAPRPSPVDSGPAGSDAGSVSPGEDAGPPGPVSRSAGCGVSQTPGFTCFDVDFEGATRNWCLNIPESYDSSHPYELVIGLHGCGGNNRNVHNHRAPMEADGEAEFLFVYPQARGDCWDYESSVRTGNDASFIAHMVESAQGMTCLDTERTFVHGMSSGGGMAGSVVSAGIAVAFGCAASNGRTHRAAAWYYAGRADGYYDLIHSAYLGQVSTNGCSMETDPIPDTPCVSHRGCPTSPVVYCEDERGHVWPSEPWAQGGILDVFRAVP